MRPTGNDQRIVQNAKTVIRRRWCGIGCEWLCIEIRWQMRPITSSSSVDTILLLQLTEDGQPASSVLWPCVRSLLPIPSTAPEWNGQACLTHFNTPSLVSTMANHTWLLLSNGDWTAACTLADPSFQICVVCVCVLKSWRQFFAFTSSSLHFLLPSRLHQNRFIATVGVLMRAIRWLSYRHHCHPLLLDSASSSLSPTPFGANTPFSSFRISLSLSLF